MIIDKELGYLIGLMCGRGHIILKDKKIIIEFAHKNKEVYGIAYCPNCDGLATEEKRGAKINFRNYFIRAIFPKGVIFTMLFSIVI